MLLDKIYIVNLLFFYSGCLVQANHYNFTARTSPIIMRKSPGAFHHAKLGQMKHHVFIYRIYDKRNYLFRAFCAGSIIRKDRVLSSAHCFLTNRKRLLRSLNDVKVVAGILITSTQQPVDDDVQQWRQISHIYSQKYYRFPAFNLAVLEIDKPWVFNQFVNKIPYASIDQDFDGVCITTTVRSISSWAITKTLCREEMEIIPRKTCEIILLKSSRLYICTAYNKKDVLRSSDTEGGGVVCFGTNDPAENGKSGLLVGVTSLINLRLPTLHNRVGLFSKWVTDGCTRIVVHKLTFLIFTVFLAI